MPNRLTRWGPRQFDLWKQICRVHYRGTARKKLIVISNIEITINRYNDTIDIAERSFASVIKQTSQPVGKDIC